MRLWLYISALQVQTFMKKFCPINCPYRNIHTQSLTIIPMTPICQQSMLWHWYESFLNNLEYNSRQSTSTSLLPRPRKFPFIGNLLSIPREYQWLAQSSLRAREIHVTCQTVSPKFVYMTICGPAWQLLS